MVSGCSLSRYAGTRPGSPCCCEQSARSDGGAPFWNSWEIHGKLMGNSWETNGNFLGFIGTCWDLRGLNGTSMGLL